MRVSYAVGYALGRILAPLLHRQPAQHNPNPERASQGAASSDVRMLGSVSVPAARPAPKQSASPGSAKRMMDKLAPALIAGLNDPKPGEPGSPGSAKRVGKLLSAAIVRGLNEHVMERYGGIYEKDLLPGFPPYGGYSDAEIAESKRRAAEAIAN